MGWKRHLAALTGPIAWRNSLQNASALAKAAQGKTTAGFEGTWLFYFQIYLININ